MQPFLFPHIPLSPPYDRIFSRLGYHKTKTLVSTADRQRISSIINEAVSYCHLKGMYRIVSFEFSQPATWIFDSDYSIESTSLEKVLSGADSALFFAVTAGNEITDYKDKISKVDMEKAIIFDAVASEITDAAAGWIQDSVTTLLIRSSQTLTKKRFSPGYGDLPLSFQSIINSIIPLSTIGVTLTNEFILQPEKTVTALAGVL